MTHLAAFALTTQVQVQVQYTSPVDYTENNTVTSTALFTLFAFGLKYIQIIGVIRATH